jgi:AraC-like DNA-binding protein
MAKDSAAEDTINFIPDLLYAVARKCTPRWSLSTMKMQNWNITYVIGGEAYYSIDDEEIHVKPGDLLCIPPGATRSALPDYERLMSCLSVDFLLKETNGESASLPFPRLYHLGIRKDLVHLFHAVISVWIQKQPCYPTRTRGLMLLILHRLMELIVFNIDSSTADPRIEKLCRYIAMHYSEKLTVEALAAIVHLNKAYLGTLFRQETGFRINQYITWVRIKNAENMLKSGEYHVSEVAELCGFSDPFHFDKKFKEITGMTPSACIPKRRHRQQPDKSASPVKKHRQ